MEHQSFDERFKAMQKWRNLARIVARHLLGMALDCEIEEFLSTRRWERDAQGKPVYVRNGFHKGRCVQVGGFRVNVAVPRSRCRASGREEFVSEVLAPYQRRGFGHEAVSAFVLGEMNGNHYEWLAHLRRTEGIDPGWMRRIAPLWASRYQEWKRGRLPVSRLDRLTVDSSYYKGRRSGFAVIVYGERGKDVHLLGVKPWMHSVKYTLDHVFAELKRRGLRDPGELVLGIGRDDADVARRYFPRAEALADGTRGETYQPWMARTRTA